MFVGTNKRIKRNKKNNIKPYSKSNVRVFPSFWCKHQFWRKRRVSNINIILELFCPQIYRDLFSLLDQLDQQNICKFVVWYQNGKIITLFLQKFTRFSFFFFFFFFFFLIQTDRTYLSDNWLQLIIIISLVRACIADYFGII